MRDYEVESAVPVMKGVDEEDSEEEEQKEETHHEEAPILLLDDFETNIETVSAHVEDLERKLKLVQEGNEKLLSEMLHQENKKKPKSSLERSVDALNRERERRDLLMTLGIAIKSVKMARSRLRVAEARHVRELNVEIENMTSTRKLSLKRAIYMIKQRIENVRNRRNESSEVLVKSNEKLSHVLKQKFESMSSRFAKKMQATYRMKSFPRFILARGSKLRGQLDHSNMNWINLSEQRLKWYSKVLFRLKWYDKVLVRAGTCRDVNSYLKHFVGNLRHFPLNLRNDIESSREKDRETHVFSTNSSSANTGKVWAGLLRGI